jgi:hypothetical protein
LGRFHAILHLGTDAVNPTAQITGILLLAMSAISWALPPPKAPALPTLRWTESQPGCTFSADDGRYRYGLWTDEFGIVLAIDSQELQKAGRRTQPIFTVLLTLRYRGRNSLSLDPRTITLEFVKHSRDLHATLDPNELAAKFHADTDGFAKATGKEIEKHPQKKATLESALEEHQKNAAEMQTFLNTRSLRTLRLDPAHAEASGWVYFSATSKWIGDWKKQEEFVLRIPLANEVIEFPFALPPSEGDLLLRRR